MAAGKRYEGARNYVEVVISQAELCVDRLTVNKYIVFSIRFFLFLDSIHGFIPITS